MAFFITLNTDSKLTFTPAYKFTQSKISVGADISNNLRLYSKNGLISDFHAEIEVKDDTYFLMDKGSRNGTFLNSVKLKKNKPYPLYDGEEFKIGEYELCLISNLQNNTDLETPKNKILSEVQVIADSIECIRKTAAHEFNEEFMSDLLKTIIPCNHSTNGDDRTEILKSILLSGRKFRGQSIESDTDNVPFIINMFLKLFIEIFILSDHISQTFIGPDTIHRKDSRQLISPDRLKNYIFDEKVTKKEREKRKKFIETEIEDLISRQKALFSGYQNSIKSGIQELFNELDPALILKKEQQNTLHLGPLGISSKFLPFSFYHHVCNKMIESFETLSEVEQEKLEMRFFRPSFISGYLQSIHSEHESKKDKYQEHRGV
jgi:pSer/pThr/pTyr-binding forkhead associated (FHA) protein